MNRLRTAGVAMGLASILAACSDRPQPTDPVEPSSPSLRSSAAPGQEEAFVSGRVLARFQPGAAAAAIAAAHGASIQREVTLGIHLLAVAPGAELAVVEALSRNPNVEFAEPDYLRTFGDPAVMPVNDVYIGYKWDLDNDGNIYSSTGDVLAATGKPDADMDWTEAYEHLGGAVTGSAVIGIMDTGIRHDHQDLVGRIHAEHDFFAGDGNAADDYGHGTHVAGIAAAATNNGGGVAGVSFANTQFVIAKVCGYTNPIRYGCPLSAIAEGITWAVDNGAHVLNLSLGGSSGSSSEQAALQYARSNGVLPFCAAGNDAGSVSYPAAFPECVAVSATDWGDNLASYSNFGPQVELSAPGGDDEHSQGYSYILSAYHESATSYAFMAGTSMASPQAAGLGALLHTLGYTDDDAKLARMTGTADDLGPAGRDNQFGYGRINVHAAVSGSGGGGDTNTAPTSSFTYSCPDLSCSFTDTSTDSDGTIASWSWDFGDGNTSAAQNPSHTYVAGATYTVQLTVTDDDGDSGSSSQEVTVEESTGEGISLSATGYKVRGRWHADLTWSGATSTYVDVYSNGALVTTTANDGAYTHATNTVGGGSLTFEVCEAGTSTCSNDVTVTF